MRIAQYLTDVIGARLTNSSHAPGGGLDSGHVRRMGLTNVHKEGFEFGRGWSAKNASVKMIAPRLLTLVAAPLAWTPGTGGPITGQSCSRRWPTKRHSPSTRASSRARSH